MPISIVEVPTVRIERLRILQISIALALAAGAFVNLILFSIRNADPVIQSDSWYFLDVFIKKSIHGTLRLSDFFVKRHGFDHAQPLFKVVNLIELKFFHLNFAVGTFVAILATIAFAAVTYTLLTRHNKSTSLTKPLMAWLTICAILASLNAHGMFWTVPLSALESVTNIVILLFLCAVWLAKRRHSYLTLIVATLVLCVSSDDSAILAVLAASLALILSYAHHRDLGRNSTLWRLLAVIFACLIVVRIGYHYAPVTGGAGMPDGSRLAALVKEFRRGGWWQWLMLPLALPIEYHRFSTDLSANTWQAFLIVAGLVVLAGHLWFWVTAIRAKPSAVTYVATALMLLFYGWMSGIIFARIPVFGNTFILQPRYVFLFSTQLIALLLLWGGGAPSSNARRQGRAGKLVAAVFTAGCLCILAAQIPNSIQSWRLTPYLAAYYHETAAQIDELLADPAHPPADCQPWIHVCKWPLQKRVELPRILFDHKLNLYSPALQRLYPYLPPSPPSAH